jgi:hypothetical protein
MLGKKIKIVITEGWVATKQTRKADGVVTVEYLDEFNIFIRSNPIARLRANVYQFRGIHTTAKEFSPCSLYRHFKRNYI